MNLLEHLNAAPYNGGGEAAAAFTVANKVLQSIPLLVTPLWWIRVIDSVKYILGD